MTRTSYNLKAVQPAEETRKILLLGASGAGKTTFLKSMPQPMKVMDFDAKGLAILGGHVEGELTPLDGADAWADFKKDLDALGKECRFRTVGVESLSIAADSVIEYAKVANGNRSNRTNQEDWARAIVEVKDAIRKLRLLPCNVVVAMHFQYEKDELLGTIMWQPAIFGKSLPGQLPAFFNDVWLLKVSTKMENGKPISERLLQMNADQRFTMLKNSSNGAWATEEKPDFAHLTTKLKRT